MLALLGWFVRSESAHDFLHFHPSPAHSLLAGQNALKRDASGKVGRNGPVFTTQTPRWLKLGPAPADSQSKVPAGPHRHHSVAFDSLAAGLWCGLFAPAAVPILDLPTRTSLVPHRIVALPRTHWLLLPGRGPPVAG